MVVRRDFQPCDGYDAECRAAMVEDSNGDFVSYEDYHKLERLIEDMQHALLFSPLSMTDGDVIQHVLGMIAEEK